MTNAASLRTGVFQKQAKAATTTEIPAACDMIHMEPVSYTHLDVYKRQTSTISPGLPSAPSMERVTLSSAAKALTASIDSNSAAAIMDVTIFFT